MFRVISQIMRASGRPPHTHRDPSRPSRGGDRLDLSIRAITERLMRLRSDMARRITGPGPRPVAYGSPEGATHAPTSWLTPPRTMIGQPEFTSAQYDQPEEDMVPTGPAYWEPNGSPESRIDRQASGPGVLVRTPRRPAAIAPDATSAIRSMNSSMEGAPWSSAASTLSGAEASVRFTRTPDPVLQERRVRALEAERAAAAAAVEAARLAEEAEACRLEAEARREEALAAEESALLARSEQDLVPVWRRPFVPPPGVRFFRTPDRPRKPAQARSDQPDPAVPPVAAEWNDVPDWSDLQGWFGTVDESAAEFWYESVENAAPVVPPPEPAAPVSSAALEVTEPFVSIPLDISHLRALPANPAYALERLLRFEPMPVPEPANVAEPAPVVQLVTAAEKPPISRPNLSLVQGGASVRPVAEAALPRKPMSAMAARAAIRPAIALQEAATEKPLPIAPGRIPAVEAAAPEPASSPAPSPAIAAPAESAGQATRPVTAIPPRPVLLRTPKAPEAPASEPEVAEEIEPAAAEIEPAAPIQPVAAPSMPAPVAMPRAILPERSTLIPANRHVPMETFSNAEYELPPLELLAEPAPNDGEEVDADELEQNALNLQQTVQDFGVRGDILAVRPGPVVTLYELEPAPGTKSSRVIGLSDDIARSMSAVSARVAVVPGRNVIGIELPNPVRETVYLRELLSTPDFVATKHKLALCLGKNIGGEPIIADLARMPHLLVAGTTGSGKSVAINTMILSLLYRLKPEECRLIMVDPKMLELSIYDGIPHLLSPVVTDPKKAVIALKWAVREMEERYKKMAKVGVRNIDGFNARMKEARERGETITRTIQTGFNRETGEAVFVEEAMDLTALPYIVILVDEMADLMMVAGKDIEGAIQRLAQMARAAGIHLIMATQRPSVDVITGTIKANFPTRISFQVTSKIDSRTILGEMGAEQLLGQGDMLFMAGGGRTTRVHGPFCSDSEVESVVSHLKRQGRPAYLDAVTADDGTSEPEKGSKGKAKAEKDEFDSEDDDAPVFDVGAFVAASGGDASDLYEQAIAVVLRDRKASTSYIQRRLQIGYNRAASIMERMEIEGIVGAANHAGKREILVDGMPMASPGYDDE